MPNRANPREAEELKELGQLLGDQPNDDSNEDDKEEPKGQYEFGDFLAVVGIGAIIFIIGLIAGLITWAFASFSAGLKFAGLPAIIGMALCWWRLNYMTERNEKSERLEKPGTIHGAKIIWLNDSPLSFTAAGLADRQFFAHVTSRRLNLF